MGTSVRRHRFGPWLVALAVSLAGCSTSTPDRAARTTVQRTGTTRAGPVTSASSLSPADRACDLAAASGCPLAEAARRAGITVGTAGKFSSVARERLESEQFSAMSTESELLWSVVEPARGSFDFRPADRAVAFARAHHLFLTATHFVWAPPGALDNVLPAWVKAIRDPGELRQVLRAHLTAITARYGDRIQRWDAVNEPLALDGTLADNPFHQVLGDGYVAESFRLAHEVAPHAQLFLNDWGTEYLPAKADGLVRLATRLVHEGVPIDGVGLQAHLQAGDPNWALLGSTMRRLSDLGLQVVISEMDLPIPAGRQALVDQAVRAARVVTTCLQTPRCTQVTFWGFDDGDTWLDGYLRPGTRPLLFDARLRPKPMFGRVRHALLAGPRHPT